MAVTTKFSNWAFHKYHIQEDVSGGQFINAESVLVAAGPPTLAQTEGYDLKAADPAGTRNVDGVQGDSVFPIALLETFGLQQNRQLQRIFEIGSSRSYFIPGRCIGSVSLGRTFYYGPSLLRVLYAYWSGNFEDGGGIGTDKNTSASGGDDLIHYTATTQGKTGTSVVDRYPQGVNVKRTPGYGHFLIDLASDLFAQPTGLALYFKDNLANTFGGFYLENCYVQGHQMTVSSGSVLIMEGVSIQYDMLVPMDIGPRKTAAEILAAKGTT